MDSYYGQNGSRVYTTKLLDVYRLLHRIVVMTPTFGRWAFEIRWSWVQIPSRSIFGRGQIFTLFYAFLKKKFFFPKKGSVSNMNNLILSIFGIFFYRNTSTSSPHIFYFLKRCRSPPGSFFMWSQVHALSDPSTIARRWKNHKMRGSILENGYPHEKELAPHKSCAP